MDYLPLPAAIYIWWNMKKIYIKSDFKAIYFKPATNGQSDKGFLLTSTFVPKEFSAPALGLYTCIKALCSIDVNICLWLYATGNPMISKISTLPHYCTDLKFLDKHIWASSVDPDQTAAQAVWSGSTLFVILSASFGWPWVDLDLFYGKVKFGPLCFCMGKR